MEERLTDVYIFAKVGEDGPIDPVKVGITGKLDHRMSSVQTAFPFKIQYFFGFTCFTRETAREIEALFHRRHSAYQAYGEWFNLHPMTALESLCRIYREVITRDIGCQETIDKTLGFAGVLWAEKIALKNPAPLVTYQ